MMPADFAPALLATLFPGKGEWPSADRTGAPARFAERAAASPPLAQAVEAIRSHLPADFASRDAAGRTTALQGAEAVAPAAFALVFAEATGFYYTEPLVQKVNEGKTGFPARPPQPQGIPLEPFDYSILDKRKIKVLGE